MALQDATADHADHGQHHLHEMASRMHHLNVGTEAVSHLRQVGTKAFVETQRYVQPFEFGPQRLKIRLVPVTPFDRVGTHENGPESQFFDRSPGFFDGIADVMRRDHASAQQACRIGLAIVVQPVVVSPSNRRGKSGIDLIDSLGK